MICRILKKITVILIIEISMILILLWNVDSYGSLEPARLSDNFGG